MSDTRGVSSHAVPLGVALAGGAIAGVVPLAIERHHHRRAIDDYTPDAIDRAATFVPATEEA